MKTKHVSALGLGLPELKKPFKLYVHKRESRSLRVFIQTLGNIAPSIAMIASLLPQIDLSKYQPMYSEKDKERAKELLTCIHLPGRSLSRPGYPNHPHYILTWQTYFILSANHGYLCFIPERVQASPTQCPVFTMGNASWSPRREAPAFWVSWEP